MNVSKFIVVLTAIVFLLYGVGFSVIPELLSHFVTGSSPTSPSGVIDMRSTYGGMSIAVGILLFLLSRSHLNLGLTATLILMVSMAVTRTYGLLIDGPANSLMFVYLALEISVASAAGVLMLRKNEF